MAGDRSRANDLVAPTVLARPDEGKALAVRRHTGVIVGALAAATVAAVLAVPGIVARHPEPTGQADARAAGAASAGRREDGTEDRDLATGTPGVDELSARLETGRAVIDGLVFIGDSDTLAATSEVVLGRLASALEETPGTFLIEAHVPPGGDMLADQSITDRRAAVVRARLVSAGIASARLFAMGFGSTRASMRGVRARIELSRMP